MRRHAALLLPSVAIMFAASTLTPKQIRRASLVIFLVGIALMALILVLGPEIKGAKRWLQLGAVSIQPSEFVKPAFIVLTAWLFNESQKRRDIPGIQLAVALFAVFAVLLVMQPDFGQTLLVTLVWGALFYMAGINMVWIGALGAAGVAGSSRPISSCRTSPRASTASSIRLRATPIRPTDRSTPSCMAAGSAGARARAR